MFERLCLAGFQAGLSWVTILRKRPAFKAAFDDFTPDVVAGYDERDVERLLSDPGIVRNRQKIVATIRNAQATIELRDDMGLSALIWSLQPTSTPRPRRFEDIPTTSPESVALSKELRRRFHFRRTDQDVRTDGSDRHRRHAPARLPPTR